MSARFLLALALLGAPPATAATIQVPPAPPTRVAVVRDTLHGDVVEDPYRWLEDQNSPETREWVTAQMARTKQVLAQVPGRARIEAWLAPRLRTDARTVPAEHGGRWFFGARGADQQLSAIVMRRGTDGPDEVLVDPNTWPAERKQSAALIDVTPDGRTLAYGIRTGGEDELEVRLMDTDSKLDRPGSLPRMRYFNVSLTPDGNACYASTFTNGMGSRVVFHRFGDDAMADREVFASKNPTEIVVADLDDTGRWLTINVRVGSSGDEAHVYLKDVAHDGPIVPITGDLKASFDAEVHGDELWLVTNWQAPNRRVLAVDLANPAREAWKEVVPESPDAVIQDLSLAGGRLFVRVLRNVHSELAVVALDGTPAGTIALPGLGTASGVSGQPDVMTAFYRYDSYDQPATIYRYDVATGESTVWWHSGVPFAADRYEVEQVWVPSKDSTQVPMFLVHRKGMKRDGSNPTLLYGYGGFNISSTPDFSATVATWLDMGGVWAEASIRGGGEFGERWHQAGMRAEKQHTFDDFIAAAEWLIASKVTRTDRLAIRGGSNGGLLVGACMTQRPDLFGAVICAVPLLDMLRYQKFLVARFWTPEYGSSDNPDEYPWLAAYSPYQHVRQGVKYPATLMISGDSDTRVDPCHARKFTALLQARSAGGPVLLHYDTESGHSGGGTRVQKQLEDATDWLSFLEWRLGMTPVAASGGSLAN